MEGSTDGDAATLAEAETEEETLGELIADAESVAVVLGEIRLAVAEGVALGEPVTDGDGSGVLAVAEVVVLTLGVG